MKPSLLALAAVICAPLFASAARAEVASSGTFVPREACAATPSTHSDANPGNVVLEPNRSYNVVAKNKPDATHYLIEVPGAEPSRRWAPVSCGALSAGADGSGSQASANQTFLFVASWEPAFCATHSEKKECATETADRFDASHFSLHGLWPQPKGLQFCNVPPDIKAIALHGSFDQLPPENLSASVRQSLSQVMPGVASSLDRHEWWRHGVCVNGATPDSYFGAAVALMAQLNGSKLRDLFASRIGGEVTSDEIRAVMDASFGAGAGDRVLVNCFGHGGGRMVVQLEINLFGALDANPSLSKLIAGAKPQGAGCPSGLVEKVSP